MIFSPYWSLGSVQGFPPSSCLLKKEVSAPLLACSVESVLQTDCLSKRQESWNPADPCLNLILSLLHYESVYPAAVSFPLQFSAYSTFLISSIALPTAGKLISLHEQCISKYLFMCSESSCIFCFPSSAGRLSLFQCLVHVLTSKNNYFIQGKEVRH